MYASQTRWRWRRARTPVGAEPDYASWLAVRLPEAAQLKAQRDRIRDEAIGVTVDCLVLPDGDGGPGETLNSLQGQTLPNWSARVVGSPSLPSLLDRRITLIGGDEAQALADLAGDGRPRDFVLVLQGGDRLEPDLLYHIAARGWDDPTLDLVYWDDDLLDPATRAVRDPRLRPGWSPDTLLSANYVGRAFAVRRERLVAAGGFPADRGPERWWELLLRLDLDDSRVARIPRVLQHVHRRPAVEPTVAARLIDAHLSRRGERARVEIERGAVRVRWELDRWPTVGIVIPTRHRESLLERCLHGLAGTRYPEDFAVVAVDSGERTEAAERWYASRPPSPTVTPVWCEGRFNYSAANNLGAGAADGEVLVFLNDDTILEDPDWLGELVGWAMRPGIGLVGAQLVDGVGAIAHGGVVIGMDGFAGHLFAGARPSSETLFGSTDWYRNCLSVTAACVAMRRDLFDEIGGFDERFVLCGSDVVLGLDARFHGRRNVCTPFGGIRHLEGQSRGEDIPVEDFYSSYWRYQRWLRGGDPYFSPNLSLQSGEPRLRSAAEPAALEIVGGVLGRRFSVFRQSSSEAETGFLVRACRADRHLRERVAEANRAPARSVRTLNWFLPDIDSPFYGGINTALRMADFLARHHGVRNQFVLLADPNERYVRSALAAAFPSLADASVAFSNGRVGPSLQTLPTADASIATQWHTAYLVANFAHTDRRFYLIQDFEPSFYPGGSNYALAEQTYRLGLAGICNTEHMLHLYRSRYGGRGVAFMPAVDRSIFHAESRPERRDDAAVTIFIYARPGVWRNCWELASLALAQIKQRLGDGVRIVTAGSWARPDDLGRGIEHLGLLDYRETGDLYRSVDLGVALTVSEHPSYLPLELLACGTPVVAFDNPAGDWILHHERNCLRCPQTVDGLIESLERLATDRALRERLGAQGIRDIDAGHADWDAAFSDIHSYLSDPTSMAQ